LSFGLLPLLVSYYMPASVLCLCLALPLLWLAGWILAAVDRLW
jgi:hypothetical protein